MEGEEERSDEEGSFSKKSIPKRIAIVAAGGLVNIVFGLCTYFILVSANGSYISNKIDNITNTAVSDAGVYSGDKILEINGKAVHLNSDIASEVQNSNGEKVKLLVQGENGKKEVEILPEKETSKVIGIYFGVAEELEGTQILMVSPNGPAANAGIKAKDVITKVDGKEVEKDPYKILEYINESPNEEITLTIQRNNEEKQVEIEPQIVNNYTLGVTFEIAENEFFTNITYGFWDTVDFSFSIIDNLKMLFTGKVGANELMGPIGISGMVADTNTLYDFVYLLALVSLSLGVTNLLPFPPLDGGKILIYIIEAFRRKPISEELEMKIQMAGFVAMILLSVYVAYNDVLRIF